MIYLEMFHMHLRRIFILLLLDEMYIFNSIWSDILLKANVSLLILRLDDLSIDVNGVLKSPIFLFLFFFWPHNGMNKFPSQRLNLCHSSNLNCCSDNTSSLTCCTTREFLSPAIIALLFLPFVNICFIDFSASKLSA